ncbi:Cytochrome P450 90B1 [Platanthera guangdongensis]|uniref:Cytochrome P450 90B1 n=1 Tax=Platanthera guangdongensis TaxID=2320717 RepID=A0ABR2M200_9ASPA
MATILAFLLLFTALVTLSLLWFSTKEKPFKALPGNRGWPLAGETLSFLKPYSANSLGVYMKNHISRYGKIFSSNLLGREAIVSADAELNRFVLNRDGKQFKTAWFAAAQKIFGRESIAFATGKTHMKFRSIIADFLSTKRLQTVFLEDADHLASVLTKSWRDGDVISAKQESFKYCIKLMAKSTLSIKEEDDPQMQMLQRDYSHFLSAIFSLPLNIPGMKYWNALQVYINTYLLFNKVRRKVVNMVKKTMGERMIDSSCRKKVFYEAGDEYNYDLLEMLMERKEYSNEEIEDFMLGMIFAGHDSTSRAIAFMLYLLANSPSAVITALQEEHLKIINSRSDKKQQKLSWDDYKSMKFSRCVIKETLRLSSVAPFIPKVATEDVRYKEMIIPRGSLVIVHMRAVQLDPFAFHNPMNFNPWRWLDACCDDEKRKRSYMPFGGGTRMCPGENLAQLEMVVLLHHIIINYEWEMAESAAPDQPIYLPYLDFPRGLHIKIKALHLFDRK